MKRKANLIFLTGFSTAGKSTIGPILANSLGFDFIDVDRAIVELEQKSVVEIFSEKGEAYFRQRELELISQLSHAENLVVALGGGTLEHDQTYEIIKNSGTLIYLKSNLDTLTRRLSNKDDRPMMKSASGEPLAPQELRARIEQMFLRREERYKSHAVICVDTDQTPIGKTVEHLTRQIEKHLKVSGALPEDTSGNSQTLRII